MAAEADNGAPARPAITLNVMRGVLRLLATQGFSAVTELTVATGRRIDVAALGPQGEIWAIEVKSSLADYRADQKWQEYFEWCDKLFFALPQDFPHSILPNEPGIIIADAYGGAVIRGTEATLLPAARRKAMLIRIARAAADRLVRLRDPDFG